MEIEQNISPDSTTETEDGVGRVARRVFLGNLAVATAGALTVAGMALTGRGAVAAAAPAATPGHDHAATTATPSPAAPRASATPVVTDHDAVHKAVTAAFPAKTTGEGLKELPSRVVDGVREFDLVCGKLRWEVTPGVMVDAEAYNGQVPGPVIRVTEGERVRVRVKNQLDDSTAVHWHGQRVVNSMDGVPFITQPPIKPGETYTYEFTAGPFGSHMYHSHHNATEQVGRGMLGPRSSRRRTSRSTRSTTRKSSSSSTTRWAGSRSTAKAFPRPCRTPRSSASGSASAS